MSGGEPTFFSADVVKARRFFSNLNPPKNRHLVVVSGGVENCIPQFVINRKTFPFYAIEYVLHGRGEVKISGRTFTLEPGRVFSYGPGVPHIIKGKAGKPMIKYFVDFTGLYAKELLNSSDLAPGSVSGVFPPNTLEPLFDEIIRSSLKARIESGPLCAKLLECLILRIIGDRSPVEAGETHAFATYLHCREYIENHSGELRTLEQIALKCHISIPYLCRLFQRFDKESPYRYLLRLKMNYAASLLQRPDALVKQVAEEVGFTDPFHFSRVFTSMIGISPAAFRKFK